MTGDETVSWGQLLAETTRRLTEAASDDAEVSARRIVEEASGNPGASLLARLDDAATVRGVARLDSMVERRLAGAPLQYVVGRWGFRHLDLVVDERVLIPRPETEVVAGLAIDELKRSPEPAPLAVDLGTGSGAIGLSLATEHPTANVWLTDRSDDALIVARANLAGIGRPATRVNIASGAWFEALGPDLLGRFSLIVSNPPYVADLQTLPPVVVDHEPIEALVAGADGLADLHHLVDHAGRWLAPGGSLVLELAPDQADRVAARARSLFAEVEIHPDLTGRPRAIVARNRT